MTYSIDFRKKVLAIKEKEKMSAEFYIGAVIILVTVLLNALIKSRKRALN